MSIEMEMAQREFLASGGPLRRALMKKITDGELSKEYVYREYPKMLRISHGWEDVECSTEIGNGDRRKAWTEHREIIEEIVVSSEEEEERVISGGKTSKQLEEERQTLLLRAKALGLKVDPSWSSVRLRREMGDKLEAPEPPDKMAALTAELASLRQMADMQLEIERLRAQLSRPVNDEVEAMRAELSELGVTVDKRWGAARLREELERATNPQRSAA